MPVNRAVPSEQQNHIRIAQDRHADSAFDIADGLKGLEVFSRTSPPENGCRPHPRG
jgi:hypothetical protein